jgi:hypothetical protein
MSEQDDRQRGDKHRDRNGEPQSYVPKPHP